MAVVVLCVGFWGSVCDSYLFSICYLVLVACLFCGVLGLGRKF